MLLCVLEGRCYKCNQNTNKRKYSNFGRVQMCITYYYYRLSSDDGFRNRQMIDFKQTEKYESSKIFTAKDTDFQSIKVINQKCWTCKTIIKDVQVSQCLLSS